MAGHVTKTAAERFIAKVEMLPCEPGCWLWSGYVHPTGYGRFGLCANEPGGEWAHRASWRIFNGEIPLKTYVCHTCDVRSCVNPAHLFLGSPSDNMRDASRKGRVVLPRASYASSEEHQVAKLSNDQVRAIRSSAFSAIQLSREGLYPVGYRALWAVKKRLTFRDVR